MWLHQTTREVTIVDHCLTPRLIEQERLDDKLFESENDSLLTVPGWAADIVSTWPPRTTKNKAPPTYLQKPVGDSGNSDIHLRLIRAITVQNPGDSLNSRHSGDSVHISVKEASPVLCSNQWALLADTSDEDSSRPPTLQLRPEEDDISTNHGWKDAEDVCSDSNMSIEVHLKRLNEVTWRWELRVPVHLANPAKNFSPRH